ncbi:UDP-N-acetylmuramyl-tripeptide synthetase [Spirochaetia bacterium]|nr:UDP-N-acetylmuramyl-tripeptide synthetase [Spirochaetia bacterium]
MEKHLNSFLTEDFYKSIKLVKRKGAQNPLITGIEYDSRAVSGACIFFALTGIHTDGHQYIEKAIANGAKVVVLENEQDTYSDDIVYLFVENSRFAMSELSAVFYDHPSKKLVCIGITGTEGKSTTVYLIFQLLRALGLKAGFISTVQFSLDGIEQDNPEHQTTPEANIIHKRLSEMLNNGCEYAVIESSSHGLSEKTNRLGDIFFDAAVMTNVMHEHLEFHGTWEQYRFDKANLFRSLNRAVKKTNSKYDIKLTAVANADDTSLSYFASCTNIKTLTHSVKGKPADLSLLTITSDTNGNDYEVKINETGKILHIKDNLPGAFNAGNVLSSMLVISNLISIPLDALLPHIKDLKPVRGRMTKIDMGQPFEVLVDYAHTPSSFETIFPPLRKRLDAKQKRMITLFGSPGERDTKKRSEQGRIADNYSDIIILTDEDPRGEKPFDILEKIASGIKNKTHNKNLFLICDRKEAIRKAFSIAEAGDTVLLLGKGHENSIIYSSGTIKYDEIAEAKAALAELKNS